MAKYHGRRGVVYISSSGTGTASAVLGLTKWSLDLAQDKVETTEFGDSNKTYVVGLRDLQGSLEGFWNEAETKLFTGAQSADGVKVYLYPSVDAPSKYAYGPAWLDLSVETGMSDAVKVNGSIAANGAWYIGL